MTLELEDLPGFIISVTVLMVNSEGKLQQLLDKITKESEKKGLTERRQTIWLSAREIANGVSFEI